MSELQKCPVCDGRGFVKGNFYDVAGETCSFGDYAKKQCESTICMYCNGKGVINVGCKRKDLGRKEGDIIDDTIDIIKQIYKKYSTGGALHIVLDDYNTDDEDILWCLQNSIPDEKICRKQDREMFEQCAINLIKINESRRMGIIKNALNVE